MNDDHLLDDQLSERLDERLAPALAQAVDRHLGECGECRARYEGLSALRAVMKGAPLLTPPDSFYEGVLRRVERPAVPWWMSPWTKVVASAGLVGVIVVVQVRNFTSKTPASTAVSEIAMAESRVDARPPAPSAVEYAAKPKSVNKIAIGGSVRQEPAEEKSLDAEVMLARRWASDAKDKGEAPAPVPPQNAAKSDIPAFAQALRGSDEPGRYDAFLKDSQQRQKEARDTSGMAYQWSDNDRGAATAKKSLMAKRKAAAPSKSAAASPWKGVLSGITAPRNVLIQNEKDWLTLWAEHIKDQPAPFPMPVVNFARYNVVGVFAGNQPTAGIEVHIARLQFGQDALRVEYRIATPPPGMGAADVLTQPYEMRVIPKTALPVTFEEVQ